jgi:formylmethanofuran dehydrogenase subunit E
MTDTDTTGAPAATGIPLRKRSGCMCGDLGPEPGRSADEARPHRHAFDDETLERVVAFHGHLCPGLAMGMHAAAIALREVGANAPGNEVTAVVETDTCGVDGIQFLTGCTFGKGNLVHRDWGKNVYTFHRRVDGRAVRLRLRPDAWQRDPEHQALGAKVRAGEATEEEAARFRALHVELSHRVLALDPDDLYDVTRVDEVAPARDRSHARVACEACGEETAESRVRLTGGRRLCVPCWEGPAGR